MALLTFVLMKGFIDVHTHNLNAKSAVINFYSHFNLSTNTAACSLGLHPWYLNNWEQEKSVLETLVFNKNVVAIGECGLDKVRLNDWETQIKAFEWQIQLAEKLNKPLIIHCVKAYQESVSMLKGVNVPVVFHGFNKKEQIANLLINNSFNLSIGAAIFNEHFESVFRNLPLEKIFFETDNNTTISIEEIYKRAAELKKISLDSLILQIEKNYKLVFLNGR